MSELSMSREEREKFLAQTHVGIVSVEDEGRGPLSLPVWYRYEPGGPVHFVTDADSRKARLFRKAGRATLVVQTETPPYRYVTIEGPVALRDDFDETREIENLAFRYLGRELGEQYLRMSAADASSESVLVTITPERWASADFTKMFSERGPVGAH